MALNALRSQIRHRHLGLDAHPRVPRPLPTLGHGPRPLQQDLQNLAASAPTRGARASRLSQWMDSPVPSAPPPKNSPTQGQSWIPYTSYTSPGILSMSIVDAFSKNSATGVGWPRTPLQGPQHITHQILHAHVASAAPDSRPVFQRRARRTQDYLARLLEHHLAPTVRPIRARAWPRRKPKSTH